MGLLGLLGFMGSFGSHGSHVSLGSPGPPGSLWSLGLNVILILLIEVSKLLRFSISEYLQMTWLPVSRMWVAALPVLQGLEVGELQLVKVPQLLAHSGGVLWCRGWRTPRGEKYNCALCSKANSGREN